MNLHEYQGKDLLASYGVAIQRGYVASTVEEAVAAYEKLQEETGSILSYSCGIIISFFKMFVMPSLPLF